MARSRLQLTIAANVELTIDRLEGGILRVASSDGKLVATVGPSDDLALELLVVIPQEDESDDGDHHGTIVVPNTGLGDGNGSGMAAAATPPPR